MSAVSWCAFKKSSQEQLVNYLVNGEEHLVKKRNNHTYNVEE